LNKGFAIGYCGSLNPPQPRSVVVVIRGAATNEVFTGLLAKIPFLNEPAAKPLTLPGGRKAWTTEADAPVRWWYEKDDFVFSYAPPDAVDPVIATLDGKTANALKHPVRASLMKGEPGQVPVGLLFLDVKALPPMPPKAVELGLDSITSVEASWGIQGKATLTMLGVRAPRPRRGILALFDQPTIGAETRIVSPPGSTDFTLISIDRIKLVDAMLAMVKQTDPDADARIQQFAQKFQRETGLNPRNDLLEKFGTRMAFTAGTGGGISSLFGMWFHPPDFGMVAELKDAKGFANSLDRVMVAANRELKAAGAMVRPAPGVSSKPGTEYAEFRPLKAPEHGYVLAVPPSVLPTPAGFRPTILIDAERGVVAIGGSPRTARRAVGMLVLDGSKGELVAGRDAVMFSQSDPSGMLPELLASLPSLVQFVGMAATQPDGPAMPPRGGRPPFRLAIDPDAIPDVEAMRGYLFPSKTTLSVNDEAIRLSGYQAFPMPAPQLNFGMETPVLIALLLPAVQSAREAARRAQCTNNMKQIGLAMHNYQSTNDAFPASAIVDKQGKPLLSWRVAILPYIEQQALYQKFKLDEPWDSPNNKELIKLMPMTYACPTQFVKSDAGLTTYRAFAGNGALLDPTKPTRLAEITDGTSNTLMVVEAADPVTWTKPDDLTFDNAPGRQGAAVNGPGSKHPGGFNALFADGSVKFIKMSINPTTLRALITKAGGEIVGGDQF